MAGTFEQARDFFLQGIAHYQAGDFAQAERTLAASLSLWPGRPSTLTNLGATRLKLGRAEEALALLDEALGQEPGNAEALGHRAAALGELGRPQEALECLDRALAVDPSVAHAWSVRGSLLKELGRTAEAAQAFRNAVARGGDAALNHYYLAALGKGIPGGAAMPGAPPRHYVEQLFDGYAHGFDNHLEALNYRAPQWLAAGLPPERRYAQALDLGCGTGRCAPMLAARSGAVDGVDLSANMLERARALGLYRKLVQSDLGEFLHGAAGRYALVVAADVFIYVGALEGVFAGVARVMEVGGIFCFSVEEAPAGVELGLQPSLRYAHSEAYVRALAGAAGFEVVRVERHAIREDQRRPIPGLFAWLVRL